MPIEPPFSDSDSGGDGLTMLAPEIVDEVTSIRFFLSLGRRSICRPLGLPRRVLNMVLGMRQSLTGQEKVPTQHKSKSTPLQRGFRLITAILCSIDEDKGPTSQTTLTLVETTTTPSPSPSPSPTPSFVPHHQPYLSARHQATGQIHIYIDA